MLNPDRDQVTSSYHATMPTDGDEISYWCATGGSDGSLDDRRDPIPDDLEEHQREVIELNGPNPLPLEVIPPEDLVARARDLATRRASRMGGLPPEAVLRRITGLLARRGFPPDTCRRVASEVARSPVLDPAVPPDLP